MTFGNNAMQKNKYRVLLLSAPIGSGHKLAAEALEQLLQKEADVEVVHGNIFDFFPRFLGTTFLSSYLWILKVCPFVYELAYRWGNQQGGSLWLRGLLNRLLAFLGSSYLKRVAPDAVIATHATPAGIMCYYKQQHPETWLGAVITDYTIHRWWLCDGVDTYFIADERLRAKLHVNAEVLATGIPIRHEFTLKVDRVLSRAEYGWEANERVCLLMGGGEGLLPMREIIAALQNAKLPGLRLVAITGRNEKLATQLREHFGARQQQEPTEIYGFREDVPRMMQSADIIITKAGGLTSAEVLAAKLNFVIYKPLPGQEQGNADFLAKHCGVMVAKDIPVLLQAVRELCADERRTRNCAGKPQAAQEICSYLLEKLRKQKHQSK